MFSLLALGSLASSFHGSTDPGMSIPFESRKDMASIEPLSRKIVPEGETMTRSVLRASPADGSVMEMTRIEPRLVPTQRVGNVDV